MGGETLSVLQRECHLRYMGHACSLQLRHALRAYAGSRCFPAPVHAYIMGAQLMHACAIHLQSGYREGLEEGKAVFIQQGFNAGVRRSTLPVPCCGVQQHQSAICAHKPLCQLPHMSCPCPCIMHRFRAHKHWHSTAICALHPPPHTHLPNLVLAHVLDPMQQPPVCMRTTRLPPTDIVVSAS